MSYYRRGYQWESIRYLQAPTGGWNPDTPWHELPGNQAPQLDNLLIKPGRVSMRGAFSVVQDLTAYAPLNARGYVTGALPPAQLLVGSYPTAAVNVASVGTVPWAQATHVFTQDGVPATAAPSGTGTFQTNYLTASNFGFSIPVGSTILGIQVNTVNQAFIDTSSPSTNFVADTNVNLMKAGTIQAPGRALAGSWPSNTFGVLIHGGPSDLWSDTWTPADINNTQFGVAISAAVTKAGPLVIAEVDTFGIDVWYVPPGGFAQVASSQWRLIGRKTVGAVATVDHWNVPFVRPSVSAVLGTGTGAPVWLSPTANAPLAASANPTPGPRWINFDGLLYGLSYDDLGVGGTANDVNSGYITWKTKLLTLPLVQSAGVVPTTLANAPQGAYDLKAHHSRIWLLGGIDTPGGGTTHSCTALFFTVPIASGGGTASADWKDPVSGLTNQIVMDRNTNDFGVALAVVRNGLLVFRRSSVFIVRGSTTASYTASLVSGETGCIDARSVVSTDQGVYFLGQKGLMLTDGVTTKNVSGSCELTLQAAIDIEQQQVLSLAGGYATCALSGDGNILVSIGTYEAVAGAPTGKVQPIWNGLYDRGTGAWVRVTSQLWTSDGVQSGNNLYPGPVFGQLPNSLTAVGDKYVTDLRGITQDVPTALYDVLPSGATPYVSIPAVWKSRPAITVGETTLTRRLGQAKRFFADYAFAAPDILAAAGWTVIPVHASDGPYSTTLAVPISAGLSPGSISTSGGGAVLIATTRVQRVNQDFVDETDDLSFDVTWSDIARAVPPTQLVADIFGIGIEYQTTRDAK